MSDLRPRRNFSFGTFLVAFLIGGAVVYFAAPSVRERFAPSAELASESDRDHDHEGEDRDHEGEHHDHDHEGEDDHDHEGDGDHDGEDDHDHEGEHNHVHDGNFLALSERALKNIGIEPGDEGLLTLEPTDFKKSFSFPGLVRYKPGRSLVDIPAPASGVVTEIFAEEGEALCPGEPLLAIQLTHEELISCQLELLALLRKRDLLESERERLAKLDEGIEPRTRRETDLQIKENDAAIEAQKRALLALGVSERTIDETLVQKRDLLTTLVVRVPESNASNSGIDFEIQETLAKRDAEHYSKIKHYQQLEKILVEKGQTASLGDSLCVVSDLRELWIEGRAFESDEALVNAAYSKGSKFSAIFPNGKGLGTDEIVPDLSIRSVSNRIDPESRTFACYVDLTNYELETPALDGRTSESGELAVAPLLNWRFKPGQRCELSVETESIPNVFVVPADAVAQNGGEAAVFEFHANEGGKSVWIRREVVVLHRARRSVVLANESGARIAKRGARQLYLALTDGGGELQSACPCGDHDH